MRTSSQTTETNYYTRAANDDDIYSRPGTRTKYAYDAAGNTTGYSTVTATYNHAGRLQTLANGSTTETSVYNAVGQRVKISGGSGGTVLYTYDEAGHLLGEYDGTGALIEETVSLGDTPVATLRPSGATVSIYYVHTDPLNTPRQITRPSDNAVMWTWNSDPFGTDAANPNPAGAGTFTYNLRFPGQVFDGQAGLHQNGFRDFDPASGRYVESDPIGLRGGHNTYAYSFSNPIWYFDPFGLSACTDFVKALVDLWSATNSSTDLGREMLDRRGTTLHSYDGFKNDLVSGGQGGAVSRHIYGHGGAALAYPYGPGQVASYTNQAIDYFQQFQKGRTKGEADAEIADDRAAREVADALDHAMTERLNLQKQKGLCINMPVLENNLTQQIDGILCTP